MSAGVIQGWFLGGQPRLTALIQPTAAATPPIQTRTAMRPPGPPAPAFAGRPTAVQRHKAVGSFHVDPDRLGLVGSGGKPLPDRVRVHMEGAFGADFSHVRVHTGPQADRIGAIAFTIGNDIYFAPGRFQPDTVQGKQLLGHELAHVVQQRAGRVRNPLSTHLAVVHDRALEAEADRLGQRAASRGPAVQRQAAGAIPEPHTPAYGNGGLARWYRDMGSMRWGVSRSGSEQQKLPINRIGASVLQRMEGQLPDTEPATETGYVPQGYRVCADAPSFAAPINQPSTPVQGWKLHVTAHEDELGEIAGCVLPVLQSLGVAHKVVKSRGEFIVQKGTQSGKFITIYPNDHEEAVAIVGKLKAVLHKKRRAIIKGDEVVGPNTYGRYGLHHPYRLGVDITAKELGSKDPSWESGAYPLFQASDFTVNIIERWTNSKGQVLYIAEDIQGHKNAVCVWMRGEGMAFALRDPDGNWVPDRRDHPNPYDFPALSTQFRGRRRRPIRRAPQWVPGIPSRARGPQLIGWGRTISTGNNASASRAGAGQSDT